MIQPSNPVLAKMLDRLFASMVNGPSMNCRPHASRQRVDLAQVAKLKDVDAGRAFLNLIGPDRGAKLIARVPVPPPPAPKQVANPSPSPAVSLSSPGQLSLTVSFDGDVVDDAAPSPEEAAGRQAWSEQQSLLTKLRVIADDARTYEQDTGVHALSIGFPLLHLPPGSFGGRAGVATRRVLAPIAFIPVNLTVRTGARQTVDIGCRGSGSDLVIPNIALLAWLEQQLGQPINNPFEDDAGEDPWREISELVRLVAERIEVPAPDAFTSASLPDGLVLGAVPKGDDDEAGKSIVASAVLGLFPTSNQGLLRDTREMLAKGVADGPLTSFVQHGVSLDGAAAATRGPGANGNGVAKAAGAEAPVRRVVADERPVTKSDPCQARAVRLARASRGLVIHGPPGTGKSQTIANVIGDHLGHGQRVLFVCDKRTALDVVADRLRALGLQDLCATVHDPQRDQRELYRSVREQLDNLADTPLKPHAAGRLDQIDSELQSLHDQLTAYHHSLMGRHGGPGSLHHLIGLWLSESGDVGDVLDRTALGAVPLRDFETAKPHLKEVLQRGEAAAYATNPWTRAAGQALGEFLATPMDVYRAALAVCRDVAGRADALLDPLRPAFALDGDLAAEAALHRKAADELRRVGPVPAECARFWSQQSLAVVQLGVSKLAAGQPCVDEIRANPVDPALATAAAGGVTRSTEEVAAAREALLTYVAEYDAKASLYARLCAAVADAPQAVVARWLSADPATATTARKRLDAAAPLLKDIETSTLDASLLSRFESAPIEPGKFFESLAALDTYLEIAGKWHAFLQSAKKKAAEPVVRHFGLALTVANAAKVRQFLADVQKRQDVTAALTAAASLSFATRPDDGELVSAFRQHHGVLRALLTAASNGAPADAADPAVTTAAAPASLINTSLGERAAVATGLLATHSLPPDVAGARRLAAHLAGRLARLKLAELLNKLAVQPTVSADAADEDLLRGCQVIGDLLSLLSLSPMGHPLGNALRKALADPAQTAPIVAALVRSPERAAVIGDLLGALTKVGAFAAPFLKEVSAQLRGGATIGTVIGELSDRFDTLEGVLRVRDGLRQLPPPLATAGSSILNTRASAGAGYSAIRRHVFAGEIGRRLQASPLLQSIDGHRMKVAFERFRQLSEQKQELVREQIQHQWVSRQRARLLSGTGTRLNSLATDLRRRLTLRGERAMRLRQVIAHGAGVEGGDPLFDLRPVWMASPETVAQLFPREPIFDVVVFDEASQCRLEEAMPVLTRAHRVVIAGDPKQLPPTRFFESAVTASEEVAAETDQELFESHQGEVEDLLTAALGLDVDQSYLDVHYRSRNADLIGFSNQHFYGSRLQAIPCHPRARSRQAPITLRRVDGVYEKRRNPAEAQAVCELVRELLARPNPPSIGVACFNLVQRDLVVEKLEEMADQDPEFAARLAEARERHGPGSSEGLFVKNLENVQGDERDHIIISTTYGPDKEGRFRRSFGPLGTTGGGRRLNVLVTRARAELHVLTSIPRSAYASLPPVPPGQTPSGAWLLFAYLAYAEQLQQEYELNARILETAGPVGRPSVNARTAQHPSEFAKALAKRIAAQHNQGSDVHWGNEGFCVDVAMQHPTRAEDATIGVLTDMTRFAGSDDPVEWDVFRTATHEAQGWQLHRVWTPHFFRDPRGAMQEIAAKAAAAASGSQQMVPVR